MSRVNYFINTLNGHKIPPNTKQLFMDHKNNFPLSDSNPQTALRREDYSEATALTARPTMQKAFNIAWYENYFRFYKVIQKLLYVGINSY